MRVNHKHGADVILNEIGMVNLCQKGIDFVPKNNCAYSSDLIC